MTTEENGGSSKITSTVRELLAELKDMVRGIDGKLDGKADRLVVDVIDKRLALIETQRTSEREFGQELMKEYRAFQTEHSQLKIDVKLLQQQKKDKDAFNALWIPTALNFAGLVILIYKAFH